MPLQEAVITTDKGVIKAKFAYDVAPHTVENFIDLAKQGMYDDSAFHRIIKGFMIQGGDSLANAAWMEVGSGGPGYNIAAELSDKKHEKGTLSMARMGFSVDTAGSQFFIMHGKTPSLDGDILRRFGDVFEGIECGGRDRQHAIGGGSGCWWPPGSHEDCQCYGLCAGDAGGLWDLRGRVSMRSVMVLRNVHEARRVLV